MDKERNAHQFFPKRQDIVSSSGCLESRCLTEWIEAYADMMTLVLSQSTTISGSSFILRLNERCWQYSRSAKHAPTALVPIRQDQYSSTVGS